MTLNKQKGNMYSWCTHTWNPIRGRCPHQCIYCYYQADPRFKDKIGPLRLDEKALKDNLGKDRTIFVGSSTDMWILPTRTIWIERVLQRCQAFPWNTYLFQSKDPYQMYLYDDMLPRKVIVGTTVETNRQIEAEISNAPFPTTRLDWLNQIVDIDKMISIEPIMDFDLKDFVSDIQRIQPLFVSIGADSKGHNLPEPPGSKIKELIQELEKFTQVKIKKNLTRLLLNS